MTDRTEHTRLFLVTPPASMRRTFPPRLREALAAGDVAAVLIACAPEAGIEALAAALVPIIQEAGAAALVADDTRLAGHVKADGVQIGDRARGSEARGRIVPAEADRRGRQP